MKNEVRIIVIAVCVFLFDKDARAQEYTSTPSFRSYFTIGFNGANIYKDSIPYNFGFMGQAGAGGTFLLHNNSRLGIEALYSVKKFKLTSDKIKYQITYLDIPLFYQHNFKEQIRINVGIQYSVLINAKSVFLDGSKKNGINFYPLKSNLSNDLALLAGLEIYLSENVFVGFRYTVSSTIITDNQKPYLTTFQFSLNYFFFNNYKKL
jgi:Outer membrane protein beta-barrel domain